MTRFMTSRCVPIAVTLAAALIGYAFSTAEGQSRQRGKRSTNTKAIDVRASKMEHSFIREAADLAKEYSDAGDLEKSKKLLEAILKLDDSLVVVKDKIKEIDEQILSSNGADIEIDTGRGWVPVAQVFKGRKFRIEASGQFKATLNMNLDVKGLSADLKSGGIASGIPLGELIGVIVPVPTATRTPPKKNRKGEKEKARKPFRVGEGLEMNAGDNGQLLLKVNLPAGAKCTGKIKLHISGYVRTAKKSSR